jgi:hypothetical protein
MQDANWLAALTVGGTKVDLSQETRAKLAALHHDLLAIWNLGDNVVLGWTHREGKLLFLAVRHYAIPESTHAAPGRDAAGDTLFINQVLSGPKYREPAEFERICHAFGAEPHSVSIDIPIENEGIAELVSDMVRRYGVTLVRNRAVVLLDAVAFSMQPPLDQVSMLNSLAYSVNSAYGQLLSKNIRIDFARTSTGDGFYIWNRGTTPEANAELYKLMIMLLADNAVAQSKSRSSWVPKLRAAFHVGEHYEFHQVEGLNPTSFSYIVGQVTVDLARMVEHALSGQIIMGDFLTPLGTDAQGQPVVCSTADFVENAAATLDQLNGLDISGGRISSIRCYLTGHGIATGGYTVNRYSLRDKHGAARIVYNAKVNIHREQADSIFLGIQNEQLWSFSGVPIEPLRRPAGAPVESR